jgi:DNA-binding MarR family transcriptional regulator
MIAGLAKKGWVEKKNSKEDGRLVFLNLSKKGHTVLDASRKYSQGKLLAKLTELPTKKKESLIEAFEVMNSLLYNESNK